MSGQIASHSPPTTLQAVEVLIPGLQGRRGQEGPPGVGSAWLSGEGPPPAELGELGDFYLDTLSGDIYGPRGEDGAAPWGPPIFNIAQGRDGDPGEDGLDGEDGQNIELRTSATHVQWRVVGDPEWIDLVLLQDLKGADGQDGLDGDDGLDGEDGREVQLQASLTHIQWRYVGDASWVNLVALQDLRGDPGDDGLDGEDGQNIELRTSATHVQWRVVGDPEWIDLVLLEDLKGPPGDDAEAPGVVTTSTPGLVPALGFNSIPYAPTIELDLAALDGQAKFVAVTGNIAFTVVNPANGRSLKLRLVIDGTDRTLAAPIGVRRYGHNSTTLKASKAYRVAIEAWGTTDDLVDFAISEQL